MRYAVLVQDFGEYFPPIIIYPSQLLINFVYLSAFVNFFYNYCELNTKWTFLWWIDNVYLKAWSQASGNIRSRYRLWQRLSTPKGSSGHVILLFFGDTLYSNVLWDLVKRENLKVGLPSSFIIWGVLVDV